MTWQKAQRQLSMGRAVRRPDWETRLIERAGRIEWDISESLAAECNRNRSIDRGYKPSKIDFEATDWERA